MVVVIYELALKNIIGEYGSLLPVLINFRLLCACTICSFFRMNCILKQNRILYIMQDRYAGKLFGLKAWPLSN